jgi:hypothetical protein
VGGTTGGVIVDSFFELELPHAVSILMAVIVETIKAAFLCTIELPFVLIHS